jgi:PTS system nitrogen regulatory IIA component
MRLIELLDSGRVVVDLRVTSKHGLLEALARLLAPPGVDLAVLEALTERENLGSTALGDGVALPHGRCPGLDGPAAAFVRLARPVNFGAGDGKPVDLVCALVTPTHFTEGHLGLLAEVATRFSDPACRAALRTAPDATALRAELAKWG